MANEESQTPTDEGGASYMDEQYADGRLDSGAGATPVDSDLDFINMSGLTTPVSVDLGISDPMDYTEENLRPDALVSFFEEGVDDVDSDMDPGTITVRDEVIVDDQAVEPPSASAALSDLDDLISGITKVPVETKASFDVAAVDAVESQTSVEIESLLTSLESELQEQPETSVVAAEEVSDEVLAEAAPVESPEPVEPVVTEIETAEAPQPEVVVDFQEAKSLVQELEPRAEVEPVAAPVLDVPSPQAPEPDKRVTVPDIDLDVDTALDSEEQDASVYRKPQLGNGQSRNRQPKNRRRGSAVYGIKLALFSFIFLIVAAAALYYSVNSLRLQTMLPSESYAQGMTLLDEERYADASEHFAYFTSRYASDPLSADAAFMSAYALYLTPSEPRNEAMQVYSEARDRMEDFVLNYPGHRKAARGETLLAMLEYRLGDYGATIDILSDPQRRLRDPDAFLPALRTLARAHSMQGNLQMAETEFMRAATLKENISPDQDYMELASIYNDLGVREQHAGLAASYLEKAVENWGRVMQLPGTFTATHRELEVLSEYTRHRIRELTATGNMPGMMQDVTDEQLVTTENSQEPVSLDSLRLPDDGQ